MQSNEDSVQPKYTKLFFLIIMTFIVLDLDKRWSEVEERIEINALDQT